MTQVLNNIRYISFIDSALLTDYLLVHGVGVFFSNALAFTHLPVVGLAQCEISSKIENNTRLFTHNISARLSEHFNPCGRKLAFLLETVTGDRFLVGFATSPHPIVNTSDIMPGKESDPSGCNLTIEYTDTFGLMPVFG